MGFKDTQKIAEQLYNKKYLYKNIVNNINNLYNNYRKLLSKKKNNVDKKKLSTIIVKLKEYDNILKIIKQKKPNIRFKSFKKIKDYIKNEKRTLKSKLQEAEKQRKKLKDKYEEIKDYKLYDKFSKYSKLNSNELDSIIKQNYSKEFEKVRTLIRNTRRISKDSTNKNIPSTIQGSTYILPIINKPEYQLEAQDFIYLSKNYNAIFFHAFIVSYISRIRDIIFEDPNALHINYQILYANAILGDVATVRYSMAAEKEIINEDDQFSTTNFKKDTPITRPSLKTLESGLLHIAIGYRLLITYKPKKDIKPETIYDIKAYAPSRDRKFHELCYASTFDDGLCIIQSFYDVIGKRKLIYSRDTPENREKIKDMLKEEGQEIEKYVINGELFKALELLTIKYDCDVNVIFYNCQNVENDKFFMDYINDGIVRFKQNPVNVNRGVINKIIKKEDDNDDKINKIMANLNGKKCIFHDGKKHVSVSLFNLLTAKRIAKVRKTAYYLRSETLKNNKNNISGVYGFDFETGNDENFNAIPLACCIYGKNYIKNKEVQIKMYGLGCEAELIKWLISIRTKKDIKKSRSKVSIPDIYIYGFNNSRFDNLLFYEKLSEYVDADICFANRGIKYIKFDNVYIYDISLIYKTGSLRNTCKQFKLEEEKGVYPYSFLNTKNLNYVGEIPELKEWNSKSDYDEYLHKEGNIFNLKEYTLKYCLLDAKLVFRLAEIHIKNCTGIINGKKYNVIKCPTSANMSIKMHKQTTMEEDMLIQSPNDVIIKERKAFKGGRTDPFKTYFNYIKNDKNKYIFDEKSKKKLYYYDINSAHPSGMTLMMPFKYIGTKKYENYKLEIDDITDHNLYLAKTNYIGSDKFIIPNLLIKDEKGNMNATKNTDYDYHWGMELREAILNNFEIHIIEENEYEGKKIFKKFAEYFYDERLKIKKTNVALASFFKNILNSHYGKYGQKLFEKSVLCKYEEIGNYIKDSLTILTDWEVINDKVLITYKEIGDEYNNIGQLVRFSSYIAATTRCKLSEIMRDIGHEHIYYCDTDSIFTDKKPSDSFLDNNILGKWKLECEINKAIFLGKKFYTYTKIEDNKEEIKKASKGVDSYLIEDNDFIKLLNKEKDNITITKKMFFKSYLGVKIKDQERNVKSIYNKRNFIDNESFSF